MPRRHQLLRPTRHRLLWPVMAWLELPWVVVVVLLLLLLQLPRLVVARRAHARSLAVGMLKPRSEIGRPIEASCLCLPCASCLGVLWRGSLWTGLKIIESI